MNSSLLNSSLFWALVGIVGGWLVSLPFYVIQRRKDKEEKKQADEQHDHDQEQVRSLDQKLTEAQKGLQKDRQLRKPVVGATFAEPRHQQYVARPEILTELLGKLFISQSGILIVGGDFGVGKTWAARELAKIAGPGGQGHVAPFQGGLLCATLGPSPVIRAELKSWYDAVLATSSLPQPSGKPAKPDPTAVASPPKTEILGDDQLIAKDIEILLNERRPLVIIDDVWHVDDAESLLLAARTCPVLLTTSVLDVYESFITARRADGMRLVGLSAAQARQLLGTFVEPALPAPGTPTDTAVRKRDAFLRELSSRIDTDPFTVVQTGAHVRDKLSGIRNAGRRPTWATISEQTLTEIVQEIAELPEATDSGATDSTDWIDRTEWIQPEHPPGPDVYQARLDGLRDPVQQAVLRTLSLLRPRPEQFTAAEIAVMLIPRQAREGAGQNDAVAPPSLEGIRAALNDLADGFYLERTETGALDRHALPAGDGPATLPEFRYSLHNRARRTLTGVVSEETRQAFHEQAVDYWRSWIDPRHPDSHIGGASSYQIAMNRDGVDWLRAARNLIYHLRHLDDPLLARQTFAAIYFELFFWWGMYLRYEVIEEFVRDWQAESRELPDSDDHEWFAAVTAFQRGYQPGQDTVYQEDDLGWRPAVPDYQHSRYDWPAVTVALKAILRTTGLDGPPDQLTQHDQWHTRAIIEILLADSLRQRPPAETRRLSAEIDGCHKEARELIQRCCAYDEAHGRELACDWIFPWIDWQEAEEALRRAELAEDTTARTRQWEIATDMTASAIRGALAGDDEAELTGDRDDLDYELLASACLTQGDLLLARDGIRSAATWYADAAVLARAWLYRPRTDDYTRVFSGEVSEHARRALAASQREAAAGGPDAQAAAAAIALVLRNGYAGQWGATPVAKPVNSAVLDDPIRFMGAVMGPPLRAGEHDPAVDPIPAELARAADRVIAEVWDAVQPTPANQPA
jgi:hypothetical protein